MVANSKPLRRLGDVAAGTRVRLHSKYRADGSARPRFRFGRQYLQGTDLVVVEHRADYTLVNVGQLTVPLWSGLRLS